MGHLVLLPAVNPVTVIVSPARIMIIAVLFCMPMLGFSQQPAESLRQGLETDIYMRRPALCKI
jgi:hypothetical protein